MMRPMLSLNQKESINDQMDGSSLLNDELLDAVRRMAYIAEYRKATRGTRCELLPVVDGLGWSLDFPAPFLWRAGT